ncbi:MAG: glycosyltransferase [Bryobacteraceae bacterium]|nr:glycosyltransferase [Bryobacteraceae bacterium]
MEDVNEQSAPQNEPLASVLIVCYNRKESLRRCLRALDRSNERGRLDIIVLDTGSRDGSNTLDVDFPGVTFLRMPRNFGATKALNIGIRTAKAGLLFLLDPAIEVLPQTLPKLAELLEQTADAGGVCPLLAGPDGNTIAQVRNLPDRPVLAELWRDPGAIPASVPQPGQALTAVEYPGRRALLVRRSFLKGMNYFDERYGEFGGDLELAYQIRHAGKKAYIAAAAPAVDHAATEPVPDWSAGQRALLAADRLNGVAHFLGKRAGIVTEWILRFSAVAATLLRALTFQDPGFNWPLLTALLGGQKIDGSQSQL